MEDHFRFADLMMNLAEVTNDEKIRDNDDNNRTVVRIVMDGNSAEQAIQTMCHYPTAYPVYQQSEPKSGALVSLPYFAGLRLDFDNELSLQLCPTGGSRKFDYLWDVIGPKRSTILGLIYFANFYTNGIEAVYDDRWHNIHNVYTLGMYLQMDMPIMLAVNNQTRLEGVTLEDVCQVYHVPADMPVIMCNVANYDSIKNLLIQFLTYAAACCE